MATEKEMKAYQDGVLDGFRDGIDAACGAMFHPKYTETECYCAWYRKTHRATGSNSGTDQQSSDMVALFSLAVRHGALQAACGVDPSTEAQADLRALNGALREFSPLCCLVGEALRPMIRAIQGGPVPFRLWLDALPATLPVDA